jgi:hypothetical protein
VSADTNLEDCPDNARWISNMMTLLSDRTRESQRWSAPFPTHNQDSASDLRALLPEPESECLERKSSFPRTDRPHTFRRRSTQDLTRGRQVDSGAGQHGRRARHTGTSEVCGSESLATLRTARSQGALDQRERTRRCCYRGSPPT